MATRYVSTSEKSRQLAWGVHLRAVFMDSTPRTDDIARRAWDEWASRWPQLAPVAEREQSRLFDLCSALD